MVDRESKARYHRNYYAASPGSPFTMSPNDTVDQSITNLIFNFDIVHNRAVRKVI